MKITSFGEVLWDDFPTGKKLGGAPLNVVTRLRSLGADATIISRIGNDEDGKGILLEVADKKINADLIQIDQEQATSLVKVTLTDRGSARYEIVYPCAWDRIEASDEACRRVAESDAFIFGSLATRDEVSRAALNKLIGHAKFKIFDVNLRPPHYDYDRVLDMMSMADVVKLNDCELYEIAQEAGSKYHSLEQNIHFLTEKYGCQRLCVTLGEHGAVFYDRGQWTYHGGYKVSVADTVGSGDNFLAGFTYKLLNNASADETLAFACALGAMVASHRGANPEISLQDIENFMYPA
ncbi:MAG: carbohydrate kinase [Neisseria sp.]|uniref:carbohydrate kinase family protein n=1 Tax=Neisseria sp. TaxID=192066 RepID=UPI0026DBE64E|nr:carbohydrate kinase [Neisseria sp.]MDO4641107.1 carbohydrate kinase [Neisseria sp.]